MLKPTHWAWGISYVQNTTATMSLENLVVFDAVGQKLVLLKH